MCQTLNVSEKIQRFHSNGYIVLGLTVVLLLLTAGPSLAADDWWDANWKKRVKVTLDNSDQTETLVDFPVPVTLNTTNLPGLDLGATTGADVRFRDAVTGNELKYEVETWDAATDTAVVWVKVPQIVGGSSTDYIWVYYDYDGTASYDQSTADEQAVWNANFKGVYHLKEDPSTAGSGGIEDSTANGHDGTDTGGMVSGDSIAGRVGKALQFDAAGKYIDYGDVDDFDFGTSNFSISLWVKGTGTEHDPYVTKSNYDTGCSNTTGIYIYRDRGEDIAAQYAYYIQKNCIICICGEEYLESGEDGTDADWHHGRYRHTSNKPIE